MGRTAILFAIVVSLAWQSFAAAAATVVPGGRSALVHSVMHWQEIPHHHGHDHHGAPAGAAHSHDEDADEADDGHHHAPAFDEASPAGPAGDGLAIHVDDSTESHGHLATGHGSTPALVSGILTPPPMPGGIMPGLAPAHPELPPLPDGLFRPPRTLA